MNNMFLFSFLLSFILCFLSFNILIPVLKKWHIGQYIRKEGPTRHLEKKGTPIFGGLIICIVSLVAYIVTNIYFKCFEIKNLILIFFPLLVFMIIGFSDDFLKIKRKDMRNRSIVKNKTYIYFYLSLLFSGPNPTHAHLHHLWF